MESQFSQTDIVSHILRRMIEACDLVIKWNINIVTPDYYPSSPEGIEKMAASCMMIETIGEGVKKIDNILPGFLSEKSPETKWKQIMGLRNHIAHGYFNLDAEVIFDVVKNELPVLKNILTYLSKEL